MSPRRIPCPLPAACVGVFALCLAGVGCANDNKLLPTPPPIVETAQSESKARMWADQWQNEPATEVQSGSVRNMFHIRRSARILPIGPVRISCRLVTTGAADKPVEVDGTIQAVLLAGPKGTGRPVAAWSLTEDEAGKCYRHGVVPGYILTFQWNNDSNAPVPTYALLIRWTSADGQARFTRRVLFEDNSDYERYKTTDPPQADD